MNIKECITSAISSVLSNKMRTILTMIGIIIGTSAVIMITSLGAGVTNSFVDGISSFGFTGMQITVDTKNDIDERDYLTLEDQKIIESHPSVTFAAPSNQLYSGNVLKKNKIDYKDVLVTCTNENYNKLQKVDLLYGRFIIKNDVERSSKVIIIDEKTSRDVFGRTDSVGEKIKIPFWDGDNTEYIIVGITKFDSTFAMFEMPGSAYMPITSFDYFQNVDSYFVGIKDDSELLEVGNGVIQLLSNSHKNTDKYRVENGMEGLDELTTVLGQITAFVSLVAGISLLVGGVGVMNIMLVTVTERTREIGIRKSLGATNWNIQFQFLVEAMILTLLGGIIGIIFGYFGGLLIGKQANISPVVSIPTIILTVIISSLIGIIFGVYPANKAAKLDPIEALRYE